MSIGDHFADVGKMIPYTKFTAVFSHIIIALRMQAYVSLATYGKQAAVRVSARELACNSQTNICFMNKELTTGTLSVPAARNIKVVSRDALRGRVNALTGQVLPIVK